MSAPACFRFPLTVAIDVNVIFFHGFLFLLGAHMNPAVTLAFAVVRRLPWFKVPVYCIAQLLGAFIASAVVYGIYYGRS